MESGKGGVDVHKESRGELTAVNETTKDLVRPRRNISKLSRQIIVFKLFVSETEFTYRAAAVLTFRRPPCPPSFPYSATLDTSPPQEVAPALFTSHRSNSLPNLLINSIKTQRKKIPMMLPANIPLERMCQFGERKHASMVLKLSNIETMEMKGHDQYGVDEDNQA